MLRLDQLPIGTSSRIAAIDWDGLAPSEARRLRELGFDDGVAVEKLHDAAMNGPIACRVGRMTIALRRTLAASVTVEPA